MFDEYDYYGSIRPSPIPNRGISFINAFKSRAETPDYVGKLTLADGTIVRVGTYKNTNKNGTEYLTHSLFPEEK